MCVSLSLSIYIYTYIHIYMCTYIYIYIYIDIDMRIQIGERAMPQAYLPASIHAASHPSIQCMQVSASLVGRRARLSRTRNSSTPVVHEVMVLWFSFVCHSWQFTIPPDHFVFVTNTFLFHARFGFRLLRAVLRAICRFLSRALHASSDDCVLSCFRVLLASLVLFQTAGAKRRVLLAIDEWTLKNRAPFVSVPLIITETGWSP